MGSKKGKASSCRAKQDIPSHWRRNGVYRRHWLLHIVRTYKNKTKIFCKIKLEQNFIKKTTKNSCELVVNAAERVVSEAFVLNFSRTYRPVARASGAWPWTLDCTQRKFVRHHLFRWIFNLQIVHRPSFRFKESETEQEKKKKRSSDLKRPQLISSHICCKNSTLATMIKQAGYINK